MNRLPVFNVGWRNIVFKMNNKIVPALSLRKRRELLFMFSDIGDRYFFSFLFLSFVSLQTFLEFISQLRFLCMHLRACVCVCVCETVKSWIAR